MCLHLNHKESEKFLKKNAGKEFVWMYKKLEERKTYNSNTGAYKFHKGVYSTPYQRVDVELGTLKAIQPKLPYVELKASYNRHTISGGGIHVYRNKKRYLGEHEIYIKVKCFMKDFLGCSTNEACFRSIKIINFTPVKK